MHVKTCHTLHMAIECLGDIAKIQLGLILARKKPEAGNVSSPIYKRLTLSRRRKIIFIKNRKRPQAKVIDGAGRAIPHFQKIPFVPKGYARDIFHKILG